jgi:hypothetical protein
MIGSPLFGVVDAWPAEGVLPGPDDAVPGEVMAGPADRVVQSRLEPKETFMDHGVVMYRGVLAADVLGRAISDAGR